MGGAIRYFTVTQEREVKVSATSPMAAALIADQAFKDGQGVSNEEGRTTSQVIEKGINAREDY